MKLHGPSMFAVKAKIYGVPIFNPTLVSLLMKHLAIGQRKKLLISWLSLDMVVWFPLVSIS